MQERSLSESTYDESLDASGLVCPEPVMLLHTRIGDVPVNGILKVIATDPSTQRDVPRFCQFLQHELVGEAHTDAQYVYFIRRGQ
jgi:tRNA 2-thiouridine synthesizing protein A